MSIPVKNFWADSWLQNRSSAGNINSGVGNLWLASQMWLFWWRHLARLVFSNTIVTNAIFCNFSSTRPSRQQYHAAPVAYAENFHWGVSLSDIWVICIWCALFVTSQFDVTFMFPSQRFGELCWHDRHILLHALPLFYVSLHRIQTISAPS